MTAITISKNARIAIEIAQWVRNGKYPSAEVQNLIASLVGHAAWARPRLIYRSPGLIIGTADAALIPTSASGTRYRWELPYRSGPYAKHLYVNLQMAPQNAGTPADPIGFLDVATDATLATVVARASVNFGSSDGSYPDVPRNFGGGQTVALDTTTGLSYLLTPNTQYFLRFGETDYARIQSAVVWEYSLDPDTDNGYPSTSAVAGGPIYASERSTAATMARNLWAYGAQTLWHWSAETDAAAPVSTLGGLSGQLAQTIAAPTISAAGTVATTAPAYQDQVGLYTSSGPNINHYWPVGHAVGDVALLFVASTGSYTSLATANGFTSIALTGGASNAPMFEVYWCRATSTSMSAPVIDGPASGNVTASAMLTYRGVISSGSPFDVYNTAYEGVTSTTSISHALSNNSTTPNVMNVMAMATYSELGDVSLSGWADSSLTGVTERFDTGGPLVISIADGSLAAAGSLGTVTATANYSAFFSSIAVALKP